jgi:hypothetical protein
MLDHNIHHCAELKDLGASLSGEAAHLLFHAVEAFDHANSYLAGAIEELYLLSNNIDKIPLILNDNQVRSIFKRISLITNGIKLSSKEHRELLKTKELLKTVSAMNSQNVSQLQKKLQENRETLQSVRNNLI